MKRYTTYFYDLAQRWYVFDTQTNCMVGKGANSEQKAQKDADRLNYKAVLTYASGLMLILSKNNNSPLLWLEWLADNPRVIVTKVINDRDTETIKVRTTACRETFEEAVDYINANL